MKRLPILLLICLQSVLAPAQSNNTYKQLSQQAISYYRQGDYKRSAETNEAAIALKGKNAGYLERFNAACAWALAGYPDNAFKQLEYLSSSIVADPNGYIGKRHMDPLFYSDKDLESLHKDERWDTFINRLKARRPLIANQLDSIYLDDQQGRQQIDATQKKYGATSKQMQDLWDRINRQDSINLVKVKQILDTSGWLSADSVGSRANSTLFLVIQHSDSATQEHYLPVMRQAVKEGKAKGSQLALLEDRVALHRGDKQIYGTQVMRMGDGDWFLQPLADPDHVDERRKSVGLGHLSFYLRKFDINWDVEAYKKQLPEIEEQMKRVGWGRNR